MSKEMVSVCDREVEDLIEKWAIREIKDGSEGLFFLLTCNPQKIRRFY
jgi:hypothetical protein